MPIVAPNIFLFNSGLILAPGIADEVTGLMNDLGGVGVGPGGGIVLGNPGIDNFGSGGNAPGGSGGTGIGNPTGGPTNVPAIGNLNLYVTSNKENTQITLNGVDTFQSTPNTITIDGGTIFQQGTITIRARKTGFFSAEKFVVSVITNPNFNYNPTQFTSVPNEFSNINIQRRAAGFDVLGNVVSFASSEPPFIYNVQKYIGDNLDSTFVYNSLQPQIEFNLQTIVIDEPPPSGATINISVEQPELETVRLLVTRFRNLPNSIPDLNPLPDLPPIDEPIETDIFGRRLLGRTRPRSSFTDIPTPITEPNPIISDNPRLGRPGRRIVIPGATTVLNEDIDTQIVVTSSDITKYKITKIEIRQGSSIPMVLEATQSESLEETITISDVNVSISIETQLVNQIRLGLKPKPELYLTSSEPYIYNINSGNDIPVAVTYNEYTEKIKAQVKDTEIIFSVPSSLTSRIPNPIVFPSNIFNEVGNYKVTLIPNSVESGDGDAVTFTITTKADVYVGVPDIRELIYPSELVGPDYVGTDVNFNIEYKAINADAVRLYVNETTYTQHSFEGTINANFKNLLEKANQNVSENENEISLNLKLIAFNTSGNKELKSTPKDFTIKFIKSKFTIPRNVAINRIADAFIKQFDESTFNTDSSRYLNHFLHLGNADNKVVTIWTGSRDSLILKLYEPIPASVQPNQQVWISKIVSNPIIEKVNLVGQEIQVCNPIKGPNFTVEPDNGIGFQIYDELVGSGSITSQQLINKYSANIGIDTEKLNITYASGSDYAWKNFVHFGNSKDRVDNFIYKIEQIEFYKGKYEQAIASGSAVAAPWSGSYYVSEIASTNYNKINEIVKSFDGFEKWLYESNDSMAYPKEIGYNSLLGITGSILKPTTNTTVETWINGIQTSGEYYDKYNVNSLVNNLPESIQEDYNNSDFFLFLGMIGQHFDIIWSYINALSAQKTLEHKQKNGITNDLIANMLESFGWTPNRAFNSQYLWEYILGTNKDGTYKYSQPLKTANEEVWRRILNNLPYLLKHKGTGRAMKAIMACYGVPQSMLSILEFGGPQDTTKGGITQVTFDDRTAAMFLSSSYIGSETSNIKVPWKQIPNETHHPTTIEFRIKPAKLPNTKYSLVQASGSNWSLDLVQTTGSFGRLELNFGGDQATSPYFAATGPNTPYIVSTIVYAYGPDYKTGSLDFPISTEYYSNVAINRHDLAGTGSWYEVWYATTDGQKIVTSVSMSLVCTDDEWTSGSYVQIGGDGFEGNLDEVRLWRVPLQRSKFNNHTLFPDSINGNSYTASTSDLLFRLDFEYPINVATGTSTVPAYSVKNVSISTQYSENFATASNFYSASVYPYQYTPYDRTVTANVPSTGYSYGNKIRFENQYTLGGDSLFDSTTNQQTTGVALSHKARVTQKAFDRAPIDSNRLGIFFSPIKELNMDILKSFGDFNIDDYIGDPEDEYKENYKNLDELRHYYFQRFENRNIQEYIRLVKYIDKSLFDTLAEMAPARAKVSKGLLIEPHFLERSKVKWTRPIAESLAEETHIDTTENEVLISENLGKDAFLDASSIVQFSEEINNYDSEINNQTVELIGTNAAFDSKIIYQTDDVIIADAPFYDADIQCPTGSSLIAEIDSFRMLQIGMDPDSLQNAGFGLYGIRGTGIYKKRDMWGNTTASRHSIFSIKEAYTKKVPRQVQGWPTTAFGAVVYENELITNYRYKVTKLPFSGSVGIGGAITEVKRLDNYFPTHYKFVNGLGEGLQRSYFKGSLQTSATTPDGLGPVETFITNPNILRVANTGRGSGEPILEVN